MTLRHKARLAQPSSPPQRLGAAALALLATALLPALLLQPLPRQPAPQKSWARRIEMLPLPLRSPLRSPLRAAPPAAPGQPRTAPQVRPLPASRPPEIVNIPAEALSTQQTVTPEPAASAPLRLGLPTEPASRQDLRGMAERAGRPVPSLVPGSDAALSKAMADTLVPGCLGPEALKHQPAKLGQVELQGLLVIPHWARALSKGRCQ
jgi:hypothetical protein